jgi:creatinine amidohydrolase
MTTGLIAFLLMSGAVTATERPLVLQEMSWPMVEEYLKHNDMVIIPLGSTEQHGPHLPLGTDFYEAFETCKKISLKTGVVVAPVVMSGYSVYHSGFPGTLSLKPETMTRVLFETAEILIKYGFRRFMFFNYHGGNHVVQEMVIHRINHQTPAKAVPIGIGAPYMEGGEEAAPFDYHAGIGETSIMLYLRPDLVDMTKAVKPEITLPPDMEKLARLQETDPGLRAVANVSLGVPEETGKKGASHEISSNGIWSYGDPRKATRDLGKKQVERAVAGAVAFIKAWQKL